MNWYAVVGVSLLAYFCGPGDPTTRADRLVAFSVCVVIGLLLGKALA